MSNQIVCSGEMSELTRSFAWQNTSLGAIESWPSELAATVNLLLTSKFPMFLWWGTELIQFYNDAYRPYLGADKHPRALGQRGRECWQEIWPIIGPEIDRVMNAGESVWNENKLVPILRDGHIEEMFWTYSYSPVSDSGGRVRGVLVTCIVTTEQVLSERRLRTLLRVEKEASGAQAIDTLAEQLVRTLASKREDIPFAALYHVEDAKARLMAQAGLDKDAQAMAAQLPIVEVALTKRPQQVDDLCGQVGKILCDAWPEEITTAYVQPAGAMAQGNFVLLLGANPRLPFDDHYVNFFQLVGDRICGLLENEAHQEERRQSHANSMQLFETVNQQRELLASVVENAPAGIAVLDSELRVKWCNPYFANFFDSQWKCEDLIGLKLADAVPQAEKVIRILKRVRDTHEPFISTEYEHVGFVRGTTYWRWSVTRLASGDILNVSSEVTEQVAARRKLESVGERLHLAQTAARVGTYYWDLANGSLEWSPGFCEAVGFNPSERADWHYYLSQVHAHDRERLQRELLACVEQEGEPVQIHDHRVVDEQGGERWVALTGHMHRDAAGVAQRIVGSVLDITQRKRGGERAEGEPQGGAATVGRTGGHLPHGTHRTSPV